MVSILTVKAGDRLWDCHKRRIGNTTIKKMSCWTVDVIEVNITANGDGYILASWNGNAPEKMYARNIARFRRTPHQVRPDMTQPKFKVGDRVRAVFHGRLGTVFASRSAQGSEFQIKWDNTEFHGLAWWSPADLELIPVELDPTAGEGEM